MTPAEKAYYEYKNSVDKGYAGGLIPEITNYVDELTYERDRAVGIIRILLEEIKEKDIKIKLLLKENIYYRKCLIV